MTVLSQVEDRIKRLRRLDDLYYNHNDGSPLSDEDYDAFREETERLVRVLVKKAKEKGERPAVLVDAVAYFKSVGAPPPKAKRTARDSRRDVELPVELPSLHKIKNTEFTRLQKWIRKKGREFSAEVARRLLALLKGVSDEKVRKAVAHVMAELESMPTVLRSPKLDGLSLLLHYRGRRLIAAYTRGNGTMAQTRTHHAKLLGHAGRLPLALDEENSLVQVLEDEPDIYVRGELCINLKAYEKLWSIKALGEDEGYKNPRAAMSGWLNSDTPREDTTGLIFVAYDVYVKDGELGQWVINKMLTKDYLADGGKVWNHQKILWISTVLNKGIVLAYLETLGFKTYCRTPFYGVEIGRDLSTEEGHKKLNEHLKRTYKDKEVLPVLTDGMVVEFSNYAIRGVAGVSGGRPAFAYAYKVSASDHDNAESELSTVLEPGKGIRYEPSKSAALKPTVYYNPVKVSGATLSQATGNNVAWLIEQGIGPGTKVRVVKAGGVIPKIFFADEKKAKASSIIPKTCSCGAPAISVERQEENGDSYTLPDYYCSKPKKCPYVQFAQLEASVGVLGLTGLGDKTLRVLFDAGCTDFLKLLAKRAKVAKTDGLNKTAIAILTKDLPEAVEGCDLSELMALSGVFTEPGFSLADATFDKLQKAFDTRELLGRSAPKKSKIVSATGSAAADLVVRKWDEWYSFHTTLTSVL